MQDLVQAAEMLEQSGDTAAAVAAWRAAASTDPGPENLARLGRMLIRAGMAREGEETLRDVILRYPEHPDAYFYLGIYHKEHGDIDEARRLLAKSVDIDEWAPALVALGHVYRRLKMRDDALQSFERAAARDPSDSEAWFGLAVMHTFVDDERALHLFQKAVSLDEGNAAACRELGHILWRMGRRDEARETIVQALHLDDRDPWAYDYLGNLLLLEDRTEAAVHNFRRAISLWPEVPLFHCNLGDALVRLGRIEEAEATYKQALSLDTNNAITNRRMGQFYREIGRHEKARLYLTRALQSDPSDRQAREALASLDASER